MAGDVLRPLRSPMSHVQQTKRRGRVAPPPHDRERPFETLGFLKQEEIYSKTVEVRRELKVYEWHESEFCFCLLLLTICFFFVFTSSDFKTDTVQIDSLDAHNYFGTKKYRLDAPIVFQL